MSYIRIAKFHPALDGQYFACTGPETVSGAHTSHPTVLGAVVCHDNGATISIGDLRCIGDIYIYNNLVVTISVWQHDAGEYTLELHSDDDPDFYYLLSFEHHDFYTTLLCSTLNVNNVLLKCKYNLHGDLRRTKRWDYRIPGETFVSISEFTSGLMTHSAKYLNDVLIKVRTRHYTGYTYVETLERIRDETVILRICSSGVAGDKRLHLAHAMFVPEDEISRDYPEHLEILAL